MTALKLVSVNVERSKHLDRVLPFIERETPDVLCVQELQNTDVERFAQAATSKGHIFVPMTREREGAAFSIHGLGMFSRHELTNINERYYTDKAATIPESDSSDPDTYTSQFRLALLADVTTGGTRHRIATTHFTWSPRGQATDLQKKDMRALLALLQEEDLVLCGDFNAPRGGEIFAMLTQRFKDNIPPQYVTSLDLDLHRAGKTRPHELKDKMVDGLFSTPGYEIRDARLEFGVSDHAAIVATIMKK
ncbi:MAG: endonuclease/exonuclease/phosphatase family protein [Candidatus Kaiserbacteria bacterium]|nr:endonuclease/exonuclease/phosphatase family protein [Candidatus Kaiserbacteria bacterium]